MKTLKIKNVSFGNLIMLASFAAAFSVVTAICAGTDRQSLELSSATFSSREIIDTMASSIETAASEAVSVIDNML